jgi:hypothetical protein
MGSRTAKMFELKNSEFEPMRESMGTKTGDQGRPRRGRPPAKHSSPDYAQMTVYVRREVRDAARIRLFQEGRELSALVERLLSKWLATPLEKNAPVPLMAFATPAPAADQIAAEPRHETKLDPNDVV